MRSEFRAKDPKEIQRLRARLYDQFNIPEVEQPTAYRIEHGRKCKRENAQAYYEALKTTIPFDGLFELATEEDYYGWGRVEDAAARVGRFLFAGECPENRDFRATAVISYCGPSAIFANLAMAKAILPDGAVLTTPVYLAMNMTLKAFSKIHVPRGFTVLKEKESQKKEDQCVVLVPKALNEDDPKRKYQIAFIDDILMTGRPLRLLKEHLIEKLKYKPDQIRVGCCVAHAMTLAHRDETTPDTYGFVTNVDPSKKNVRFPYGEGIFFPPASPPKIDDGI